MIKQYLAPILVPRKFTPTINLFHEYITDDLYHRMKFQITEHKELALDMHIEICVIIENLHQLPELTIYAGRFILHDSHYHDYHGTSRWIPE